MKNHRSVCRATAAGYTEYKGLPGRVQIGCTNTPAYKSLYCDSHKPTIASAAESDKIVSESPVGLIIAKRETRSSILYKVCINRKWVSCTPHFAGSLVRLFRSRQYLGASLKFTSRNG